jgi:hypothetical protein
MIESLVVLVTVAVRRFVNLDHMAVNDLERDAVIN